MCFVRWNECSLPFVLSIHPNLSLAFAFTLGIHLKATTRLISKVNAKDECKELNAKDDMQRVLNPNAKILEHTMNLAAVVHHNWLISAHFPQISDKKESGKNLSQPMYRG